MPAFDLGDQIRAAREHRKLSQEKLASDIGVSRPTLINYEKGKIRPDIDQLTSIAKALDADFVVDGYRLTKRGDTEENVGQLCFPFDTEATFDPATVRIFPTREMLTITAVVPLKRRS